MTRFRRAGGVSLLVLVFAAPTVADAQSYRCVGKDGKKYYGSTIPSQCVGVTVEQLSRQGTVVRRIDPPLGAEDRAAKAADAKRKREEDAAAKDDARRNRALLATYASEQDIASARARALEDNTRSTREVERTIAGLRTQLATAQKNASPAGVDALRNAKFDLKVQEDLLAAKRRDAAVINARYDEDKRRYLELSKMDASARGKALGVDKGVTVRTKPPSAYEQRRQQSDARRRAAQDSAALRRLERDRERERRRLEVERERAEQQQRTRERQR